MTNESGLSPRGKAVLIRAYEPEVKAGLIEIPEQVSRNMAMVEQRAVVIAIGPDAWSDEAQPRAAVGEKVMVTRYAGMMVQGTKDGQQYRLVNDRDLFCAIVEEA